ncbi:MAG: RNA methyltransferase [Candidatus Omnitrophica bacterium]|nr:RNA methyltransferase [Candidatus Omnitrophota bacterium]
MTNVKEITSLQNPRVKAVVDLRERRSRDEAGLMIVEGLREISLAQKAGVVFHELYLEQLFFDEKANKNFIESISAQCKEILLLPEYVFEKMTFGHRHEGVLGVCLQPKKGLKDIQLSKKPLVVVVESVEKPGNLGAILRTADAVGADGLIVCDPVTDIYNPNVIRSSLGAIFSVCVVQAAKEEALKFFKSNKMTVCATLPQADQCYSSIDMNVPLALVMGSEEKGLSEFWQKNCDVSVFIPMKGKVDSLNVSVSAAVVLYEAIRQREK